MLVVLPQHHDSISSVPDGKWQSLNESIESFEQSVGVTTFNQLWATDGKMIISLIGIIWMTKAELNFVIDWPPQ